MTEPNQPGAPEKPDAQKGFRVFTDLDSFSTAVEAAVGLVFDFKSIIELHTNFTECGDRYLIVNLKDYDPDENNYLLFLTESHSFLYTKQPFPLESAKAFEKVLGKPYGHGTVLTFLTLDRVLDSNKRRLEAFISSIKKLENAFDPVEYRSISFALEGFDDRLEEYHDLLLRLQERRYKQLETQYISFDYSVLIAESLSLQGRCRRRLTQLKDIRQFFEMQSTSELNRRIARLDDVVKRLTAITVILMVPTLISSHFGMNFVNMPELYIWWAYPAVVAIEVLLLAAGIYVFKKMGWL